MAASECCGRVMDLRDVVHRRDARVELAQPAEQLVDVDVLRPVHRGELQQDVLEVSRAAARRARAVVDEHPVGEEAAQRRLELVVVRIDEAGHDDPAAGVYHRGAARRQAGPDGDDLLALDQHVGLREVADLRVHRHDGTAADDIAPAVPAAVLGLSGLVRRGGRAGREQVESAGRGPGRRCRLQEVAARAEVELRASFVTESAHFSCSSRSEPFARESDDSAAILELNERSPSIGDPAARLGGLRAAARRAPGSRRFATPPGPR